jgi:hypothetical protein
LLDAINKEGHFVVNELSSVALNISVVVKEQSDPIKLPSIQASMPNHHSTHNIVGKIKIMTSVNLRMI